ncbi:MAG TPA: acyltransferase [Candidatus Binatus sp.]|nr:acyltransferase [Candidatus Binatus sp.]
MAVTDLPLLRALDRPVDPPARVTLAAHEAHIGVFDGLRGIAILLVVWYHVALVTHAVSAWPVFGSTLSLQAIAQTGFIGVDLFFFVSGFCLFYPYARTIVEGRELMPVREFARKRLTKIIPSYLIALTAFALLYRQSFESPHDFWRQFGLHIAFLHPLFQDSFGSISGPLWTLGIEVEFYVLFPLICWFFRRQPFIVFALLAIGAVFYRVSLSVHGTTGMLYQTDQLPAVIDLFASGMLASYLIVLARKHLRESLVRRVAFTAVGVGAAAAVVFLLYHLSAAGDAGGPAGSYAWLNDHRFSFAALFTATGVGLTLGLPIGRFLVMNPALSYLAAISYNLYLWHLEIIWQAHLLLQRLPLWATIGIAVACALAIATAVTYAIERPMLRLGGTATKPR